MSAADEKFKQKLIERYISGEASEKELQAFFGLLNKSEIDKLIAEDMDQEIMRLREEQSQIKPVGRWKIWKYTAAASILVFLSVGVYFVIYKEPTQQTAQIQKQDFAPGHNQATLTLANGKKIILTRGLSGKLAQQGNIVVQADKAVSYIATNLRQTTVAYNTMSTAKGEMSPYPLILADGTKVWLNAASSITFPVAFNGNDRKVTITGEAYFEVAHNKAMPFKVKTAQQTVEVLGTHFNISNYTDEGNTMTTLLEGKVRVTLNKKVQLSNNEIDLSPGQQAMLSSGGNLKVKEVNTDMAIDWMNGKFRCKNENLESLMRKIARWYDVQVIYQNDNDRLKTFSGTLNREDYILKLLKNIESTGEVRFKIEGRKITVI